MEVRISSQSLPEAQKAASAISDRMADNGYRFLSAVSRRLDNGWREIALRFVGPKDGE